MTNINELYTTLENMIESNFSGDWYLVKNGKAWDWGAGWYQNYTDGEWNWEYEGSSPTILQALLALAEAAAAP